MRTLILISTLIFAVVAKTNAEIDFNRQIRPILSEYCYHCHGPDAAERKADLRLDSREGAIEGGAIDLENLAHSELVWRVTSTEPDDIMPPPKSKLTMKPEEVALIEEWVKSGANYAKHWSFEAPARPKAPAAAGKLRNEIDNFVFARLAAENLEPSADADPAILLRRATLDLTGLPPKLEDLDAFLADPSDDAYAAYVDKLLSSEAFGERMALPWLDAARYADSAGYQNDFRRNQWPWRDWVIQSMNANMPFDQFTIQQLAGDLLPEPTNEQLLATAFNRNHRINNEGGIIPEEFLVEYVADRVETTSTVWLGLTAGCARCHDHKYDPISQRDFFEMFAFFHNVPENGKDGPGTPKPFMKVYTGGTEDEHESLKTAAESAKNKQKELAKTRGAEFLAWLGEHEICEEVQQLPKPVAHFPLDIVEGKGTRDARHQSRRAGIAGRGNDPAFTGEGFKFQTRGYLKVGNPHGRDGFKATQARSWSISLKSPRAINSSEGTFLASYDDEKKRGYRIGLEESGEDKQPYQITFRVFHDRDAKNNFEVISDPVVPISKPAQIAITYDGGGKAAGVRIFLDGKPVSVEATEDNLNGAAAITSPLLIGARSEADYRAGQRGATFRDGEINDVRLFDGVLKEQEVATLHSTTPITALAADDSKPAQDYLKSVYLEKHDEASLQLRDEIKQADAALAKFEKDAITEVSIMEEMPEPRQTFLLSRGAYDQPDKDTEILPTTFGALPAMSEDLPKDRLGLAKWIMSDDNPLTARVTVNRIWQQFFGVGLVKTSEDFGSQGESPSHPQLLDWLAVEFSEGGWDTKKLVKLIVTSSTYRQNSAVTPQLLDRDPENRLLARGPRFRLYGEALRDQALAVSGLLEPKIGGPPVMPYQPEGLWEEVSAKGYKWVQGTGSDLHRRSLYTFWRRTVPPPNLMNFDGNAREVCSVRSGLTNTPLQAMNLMNDPQYVEAARALAERMIAEGGDDPVGYGYRLTTGRYPNEVTKSVLQNGYDAYLADFSANSAEAAAFLQSGQAPAAAEDADLAPQAAMMMVANLLMNLDTFVTKE
ncbi:MAG: DUF1553 domain-containing protein [Verrucomicrobiota bacterium]